VARRNYLVIAFVASLFLLGAALMFASTYA
jgi:hypothetical protein